MNLYSSSIEKYNSSYTKWFKALFNHFITWPADNSEEMKIVFLHSIGYIISITVYLLVLVTFPISFPIITFFRRTMYRRSLVKEYSRDKLKIKGSL